MVTLRNVDLETDRPLCRKLRLEAGGERSGLLLLQRELGLELTDGGEVLIEARTIRKGGYVPSVEVMRELLGTPWMSEKGCQLSIPPSYAEHVGVQLIAHLESEVAA